MQSKYLLLLSVSPCLRGRFLAMNPAKPWQLIQSRVHFTAAQRDVTIVELFS